jgi:uncharacterized membrane protein
MYEFTLLVLIVILVVGAISRSHKFSRIRIDIEQLKQTQENLEGVYNQLLSEIRKLKGDVRPAGPLKSEPAASTDTSPPVKPLESTKPPEPPKPSESIKPSEPIQPPRDQVIVAPAHPPLIFETIPPAAAYTARSTAETISDREQVASEGALPSVAAVAAESGAPPPPPEQAIPEPPVPEAATSSLLAALRRFDWESLIGVRVFSYVAGVALLVAVIAFLRYSLERGWLGAPVRMAMGLMLGTGLLVACETRRAQRYRTTAHALTAAGVATLFSTFYASHVLWNLIESSIITFVLLALVAGVAVALSIRRNSIFIAILGLLGGFSAPILLSTGQDNPIGLFGYIFLLDVCLAWVAYKKRWPLLSTFSLVLTGVYQIAWVAKFFNSTRMPLAIGIFLIFPLVAFGSLLLSRWKGRAADEPSLFQRSALGTAILPACFALYLACSPTCGAHYGLLFAFLFIIAVGLMLVATLVGPEWIHVAGACTVMIITASFLGFSYDHNAWPALLFIVALFMGLYVAAPLLVKRLGHPFNAEGGLAMYVAPLLLFVFPVLAGIEPAAASALVFFGALFVLAGGLAAYALAFENGGIHFLASAFVLASEAIWSVRYLKPENLLPALLVYGGFGLFYLGVPVIAERRGKPLRPEGSGAIVLFASLGLLFFLATGPIAEASLAVMAVLMGILNLGLLYEASRGRHPILAVAGMALSWVVMAVWWMSATLMALFVPALAVMAGFALLAMGGSIWARNQAEKAGNSIAVGHAGRGVFLGLAGHLFLFAVVVQPQLAANIWPWLAVLAVLDLAIGVAALALRRGELHLASVVATGIIFIAWLSATSPHVLPALAPIGAAVVLAAFALGWTLLAERRGATPMLFVIAAGAASFLAQASVALTIQLFARSQSDTAGFYAAILAAYILLLLALLTLAWRTRQHLWSVGAAISLGIAVFFWSSSHELDWSGLLGLAAPIYFILLLYPLARRSRAINERLPFVASLVGSAFFFWFGRRALIGAGAEGAIGILPVTQALLLVPHLRMLVRMEPPSKRDLGRLALVAGAVLAFLTVAIPLQLEKQWITLGWALQGAALAWLYRRLPHKGLLFWLATLLVVVFARLTFNPAVFDYHPRAEIPILNWYFYTWLVAAGCFFAATFWLRTTDDRLFPQAPRLSKIFPAAGTLLLFLLLNIEIADFYSTGEHITFAFSASLAQNLTYTIGWGLFASGLLVAGVLTRSRLARIASILLLSCTVLKAFLYDLSELKGLYRVASFVGLAICLVLVAMVLQRFVLKSDRAEKKT